MRGSMWEEAGGSLFALPPCLIFFGDSHSFAVVLA